MLLKGNTFNFQKPNETPNVIICRQLNRIEMIVEFLKKFIPNYSASEDLSLVLNSHISGQIDNKYV